jgi:hypothetical protein
VLALTVIVVVSLAFAPARGLVWEWLRRQRQRRAFALDVARLKAEGHLR